MALESGGLAIFDVSDSSKIRRLGGVDNAYYIHDVQVIGNVAYAAGSIGLHVFDVSDPANIRRLGSFDTSPTSGARSAMAVQVVGNLAYVVDHDAGLQVLDVSDPARIRRLGGFDTSGFATDVEVVANLAYVADWDAGLEIFDVTDPTNIRRLGRFDTAGSAGDVQVVGNFAYVADLHAGLQVLDVSRPFSIRRVGGFDTSGLAQSVHVVGNLAYVADSSAGLQVFNVSDPANIRRVGGFDTSGLAQSVHVVGNLAYVADDSAGLLVLNVSDPGNIRQLSDFVTGGTARSVQVVGKLAYLADGRVGLRVLDVSDPANITPLGGFHARVEGVSVQAVNLHVIGNLAYVAADYALQVLDVSDPASIRLLGTFARRQIVSDVHVVGNVAYVAEGYAGLAVLDVSDPPNIRPLGGFGTSGFAESVQVIGNLAYVAEHAVFPNIGGHLQVLDVSDPVNIRRLGGFEIRGPASDVHVVGRVAYVADIWTGLHVLDVSDPPNIRRLDTFNNGNASAVQVVDNLAFLAGNVGQTVGVQVLDVSDPADIRRLGGFGTSGAEDLQVLGNVAFVADGEAGLQIIRLTGLPLMVNAISPSPVPVRNGRQWLTLSGEQFSPQARVTLRTGNQEFPIPPERMEFVNASEIRIFVNVTDQPASWTAEVRNPNGDVASRRFDVVKAGAQTSAQITGIVRDGSGQAIAGATVTLSRSGQVVRSAQTSADGSFRFDALEASAYSLTASKASYASQTQLVSLWDNLELQFVLAVEMISPTQERIEQLPFPIAVPSGSEGSKLMVFRNGEFVEVPSQLSAEERMRPTIVLTHGWLADSRVWPVNFARGISTVLGGQVNIFAWDWAEAANDFVVPELKTTRQGYELGKALYAALSPGYRARLHFIGHSLGTLVNASAANFLHGDRTGVEMVASPAWSWEQTQVTLLDEAELAVITRGGQLIEQAIRRVGLSNAIADPISFFDEILAVALEYGKDGIIQGKPPLPVKYAWADNYVSLVGFQRGDATVCLTKSVTGTAGPGERSQFYEDLRNYALRAEYGKMGSAFLLFGVRAHSYSWMWYQKTITRNNLIAPVHLGFYGSSEYSLVNPFSFPETSLAGTFWEQDTASILEEPLVQSTDPNLIRFLDCCQRRVLRETGLRTWEWSVDVASDSAKTLGDVYVDLIRQTGEFWEGVANYIGQKALDGSQKVVQLGSDAMLRITLQSKTPTGALRALNAQNTSALVLPVVIPPRALFMQFDYVVSGDIKEDFVFFGTNESNFFTLEGKFIPTNSVQTSQPIEVISLAGSTNNLVFGLGGGTSTNCTVIVQGIRFILDDPALSIGQENGEIILSWPADAVNWTLESASAVPTAEWLPSSAQPSLVGDQYLFRANSASRNAVFYRLRRE